MGKILGTMFRCVVGGEYGFFGEGNEQWYYTVALAISNILAWTYLPECALIFTILSAIHLISVHLYAFNNGWLNSKNYSVRYFVVHLILLIVGLITNWWWTILSSIITILAVIVAPDCVGESILTEYLNYKFKTGIKLSKLDILLSHTILLALYVFVTFMIPTHLWVKIVMVVAALLLHVLVDLLSCECVIITDCTNEALDVVFHGDIETRMAKEMDTMNNKED